MLRNFYDQAHIALGHRTQNTRRLRMRLKTSCRKQGEAEDCTYVLPTELTIALGRRVRLGRPRFFTPDEEELKLAFATVTEFFGDAASVDPLFPIEPKKASQKKPASLIEEWPVNDERIRRMMEYEMSSSGRSATGISTRIFR